MWPILNDGDIVAIDHAERDPTHLDGKTAAFRLNGGVTIKWCRFPKEKG
ncbi:MAG: S24 family peptidase [Thermodesulfobacteriota bacterium]